MPPSPRPQPSLSLPKLYAIVDAEACARAGLAPLDVARSFLAAGVRCLQLRLKGWDSGPFLDLALTVVAEADRAGGLVIVNDRADIAALSGAHGLHVGQDDLSPSRARRIVGPQAAIGLSTHTREQWEAALSEPISYLAIGPVYGTGTKATGYDAVGLDTVRAASTRAAAAGVPVVAIGGITLDTAAAVLDAGAASVAVISDLLTGEPEARAGAYLRRLSG